MLPALDPYAELRVKRTATRADIHAAYKRRAKATHPDKGGDEAEFHRVKLAYDILKDQGRREKYDATGDASETTAAPNPDAGAIDWINRLLGTALGGDPDPLQYDLAAAIIDGLTKHAAKTQDDIDQVRKVHDRARRMRKRFKRRGDGDNVLDGMVAWHEQQSALMIAKFKQNIADIQRAVAIMTEYGFEKDSPVWQAPQAQSYLGTSAAAGSFFWPQGRYR